MRNSLLEVYKLMLERVRELKEQDRSNQKKFGEEYDGFYSGQANELVYWIKELENTEEINPTKD